MLLNRSCSLAWGSLASLSTNTTLVSRSVWLNVIRSSNSSLPVAGGFFTGRYTSETNDVEEGSRFDPNREQGKVSTPSSSLAHLLLRTRRPNNLFYKQWYRVRQVLLVVSQHTLLTWTRYWQDYYFEALASIQAAASKHNLTMTEVALRWVSHHSLMKRDYGDSILIGASSLKHIEEVWVTWPFTWWIKIWSFFVICRIWMTWRKDLCVSDITIIIRLWQPFDWHWPSYSGRGGEGIGWCLGPCEGSRI